MWRNFDLANIEIFHRRLFFLTNPSTAACLLRVVFNFATKWHNKQWCTINKMLVKCFRPVWTGWVNTLDAVLIRERWTHKQTNFSRSENADTKTSFPDLFPFFPSNFYLKYGGGKDCNASPRKRGWVGPFEPNWEVCRTSITPDQLAPLMTASLSSASYQKCNNSYVHQHKRPCHSIVVFSITLKVDSSKMRLATYFPEKMATSINPNHPSPLPQHRCLQHDIKNLNNSPQACHPGRPLVLVQTNPPAAQAPLKR